MADVRYLTDQVIADHARSRLMHRANRDQGLPADDSASHRLAEGTPTQNVNNRQIEALTGISADNVRTQQTRQLTADAAQETEAERFDRLRREYDWEAVKHDGHSVVKERPEDPPADEDPPDDRPPPEEDPPEGPPPPEFPPSGPPPPESPPEDACWCEAFYVFGGGEDGSLPSGGYESAGPCELSRNADGTGEGTCWAVLVTMATTLIEGVSWRITAEDDNGNPSGLVNLQLDRNAGAGIGRPSIDPVSRDRLSMPWSVSGLVRCGRTIHVKIAPRMPVDGFNQNDPLSTPADRVQMLEDGPRPEETGECWIVGYFNGEECGRHKIEVVPRRQVPPEPGDEDCECDAWCLPDIATEMGPVQQSSKQCDLDVDLTPVAFGKEPNRSILPVLISLRGSIEEPQKWTVYAERGLVEFAGANPKDNRFVAIISGLASCIDGFVEVYARPSQAALATLEQGELQLDDTIVITYAGSKCEQLKVSITGACDRSELEAAVPQAKPLKWQKVLEGVVANTPESRSTMLRDGYIYRGRTHDGVELYERISVTFSLSSLGAPPNCCCIYLESIEGEVSFKGLYSGSKTIDLYDYAQVQIEFSWVGNPEWNRAYGGLIMEELGAQGFIVDMEASKIYQCVNAAIGECVERAEVLADVLAAALAETIRYIAQLEPAKPQPKILLSGCEGPTDALRFPNITVVSFIPFYNRFLYDVNENPWGVPIRFIDFAEYQRLGVGPMQTAGMVHATQIMFESGNVHPGDRMGDNDALALWDGKEYRNFLEAGVLLICDVVSGRPCNYIEYVSTRGGYTPIVSTPPVYFNHPDGPKWFPQRLTYNPGFQEHFREEGYSAVFRGGEPDADSLCARFVWRDEFRIQGWENLFAGGFVGGLGHFFPRAWASITLDLCCDGRWQAIVTGSKLPSHAVYVDGYLIGTRQFGIRYSTRDLVDFYLRGDDVPAEGEDLVVVHGRIGEGARVTYDTFTARGW